MLDINNSWILLTTSNLHSYQHWFVDYVAYRNSGIFWHIKVTFCTLRQSDVIFKHVRFEEPSVKRTFDLLTQILRIRIRKGFIRQESLHRQGICFGRKGHTINVDLYISTPFSGILYYIHFSYVTYWKTYILQMWMEWKVNWTYGSREEDFCSSFHIFSIQLNPSWPTLWVVPACWFPMTTEACTPSSRRIGQMGWKWHHFGNGTFGAEES